MKPKDRLQKALHVLLVVVAMIAAATVMWAAPRPSPDEQNDQDRYERRGFRNDHDWDDMNRDHRREAYAIGLWGDMPYNDVQALTGVPNLIQDMNSQHLAFTIHDGDLKGGNGITGSVTPTTCSDQMYLQALGFFNALEAPAALTPGDNDWTDCDRTGNGPFNSLERLDHERQLFFNTHLTLGQHRLHQAVQTDPLCKGFKTGTGALDLNGNGLDPGTYNDVPCVENRRWTYRGVTYATLNIQGSCNNRCGDHADATEADYRQDAVIAWMQETFQVAKDRDSAAVMFISQADPGFNQHPVEDEPIRDPRTLVQTGGTFPDGYQEFLLALREEVITFGKPVVYVHGDTHFTRIDKPFLDSAGARLENFTRIETFGDNAGNGTNDVNWIKVFVNPESRDVFWFQHQIVPGNKVVHPIP